MWLHTPISPCKLQIQNLTDFVHKSLKDLRTKNSREWTLDYKCPLSWWVHGGRKCVIDTSIYTPKFLATQASQYSWEEIEKGWSHIKTYRQTAVQDNTTNLKKLIASVTMTALFIQ